MKNIIKYSFFIVLFVSCGNPKLLEKEVVGVWKSTDGAFVELRKDHSVDIIKYPINMNNSDFKGVFNGKGTWELYKEESIGRWVVKLSIVTDRFIPELNSDGIEINLLISNNGIFDNREDIESLFLWKGDPDLDIRYEFKKV